MSDYEWQDPFAEDEAAREREGRRAEREERRRGRRKSLADKVRDHRAAGAADAPPADRAAAPEVAAAPENVATPEGAAGPERAAAPENVATPGGAAGRKGASGSAVGDRLLARRLVGVLIVAAVAGVVAFGVVEVVDRLGGSDAEPAAAPKAAKVEDLTIPEGLDRRQIADVAKDAGLKGDYSAATKRAPKGFDPAKYGAKGAPNLEGFLFPATYELEQGASAKDLVGRQLDAFRDNLAGVDLAYAKSKNLSVYDVLKIASMVEREVQEPSERRLVASVIYNRLAAGTPLGIDATIRYEDQNYDEQLVESRLNEDTPYNTRLNPGLPPTPIANPGLASIEAAAKPAKTDLFYFVVKPGSCGKHVFTKTEAQFEQASADYQ
ncbi:MAG: endolytic transglycosylase MltG, partial [Solirubrobacterales bacterium]|nr:endolytic transglycosylase MltG [Solirubrobacterales bacterium]